MDRVADGRASPGRGHCATARSAPGGSIDGVQAGACGLAAGRIVRAFAHNVKRPVEPRVRSEVVECRPARGEPGRWQVAWLVHNDEPEALEIHNAWIPHGRFRGDGRIPLTVRVDRGGSARLEFPVASAEAGGTVVRNAFLILEASASGHAWRVFARMRVEFDTQARPWPIVEVVTSQSLQ